MIHTHGGQDKNANEPSKLISEVAMVRLQFKVLVVHLQLQYINSIYIVSTEYLQVSTKYLHSIYTVSTQVLVRLQPGDNELKFDFLGVTDTLRVTFADRASSALYTVR